jgi:hypothetical protein
MVTFEDIKNLVAEARENPFQPMTIVLDSGERIELRQREHLLAIRGWDIVFVQRPEDAKARLLDPGHIKEIIRTTPAAG